MTPNRLRDYLVPQPVSRVFGGCPEAFVPMAVPMGQMAMVQEAYRRAAELTRAQLAPPRPINGLRWNAAFSNN